MEGKVKIDLKVITPNRVVFSDKVERFSVPSVTGEITILPKHISLFTPTVEGELRIVREGEVQFLSVGKGILEVGNNQASFLIEDAFHSAEINEQEVLAAKENAEKILKEKPKGEDLVSARAVFRRSLIDLKVARRKKRTL
ncbi:ATP synthase F1 subunit epsilon [candidate division WWE3 bacterium CG06_land_8_20_14_3_00_42_16]|uniref:ATP synthase epsilon chain n=4 Tax=Katanobacteria TaxID=422282 RepID=A0A2M7AND1_UNCKA|nr:MAG: ATP synthase F1 subunit epsilon [bacterium CG1_02_42_9]PIU68887.1 MAG: ATP synthase F1 subunit epsilon [candidate division WWE3 bacterium CG06_land_8_20_14_3_00_42_16]PIZ42460.1 MAG: ATP synthase F1 subunit epsilon [candidate division WWE3 bacterium CG_4_10_14_0_2_um_filter_42_8]PJA37218.1 MAG: ATP synthase F1 subunit epsilon [candidate division WWE3 bacterium CG_4_9_14_3_um_filter_43_9]